MNKNDFVNEFVKVSGMTKKDGLAVVDSFIETIKKCLINGKRIQFVGFGTFDVAERAEHKGRNLQTGEEMIIPASKSPRFKPGKVFKDEVNNK